MNEAENHERPGSAREHDRIVAHLRNTGNWSELFFHFMAHRHKPAIKAALFVLQTQSTLPPDAVDIVITCVESLSRGLAGTPAIDFDALAKHLSDVESEAVSLLSVYSTAWSCTTAADAKSLAMAMEATEVSIQRANEIGRPAISAMLYYFLGCGAITLKQWKKAREAFANASNLLCDLTESEPELYISHFDNTLQKLLSVSQRLKPEQRAQDYRTQATTLFYIGEIYRENLLEFSLAKAAHLRALDINRKRVELGDPTGTPSLAQSLLALARLYFVLRLPREAKEHGKSAEALFEQLCGISAEFETSLQQCQQFLSLLQQEATEWEKQGLSNPASEREAASEFLLHHARAFVRNATIHRSQNRLAETSEANSQALRIFRKLSETQPKEFLPEAAKCLSNIGLVELEKNHFEASFVASCEAINIFKRLLPEQKQYAHNLWGALFNLGALQANLKQFGASIAAYEEALALLIEADPSATYLADIATTFANLGAVNGEIDDGEAAIKNLEKAVETYRKISTKDGTYLWKLAHTLNQLAFEELEFGFLGKAQKTATEALTIVSRLSETGGNIFSARVIETKGGLTTYIPAEMMAYSKVLLGTVERYQASLLQGSADAWIVFSENETVATSSHLAGILSERTGQKFTVPPTIPKMESANQLFISSLEIYQQLEEYYPGKHIGDIRKLQSARVPCLQVLGRWEESLTLTLDLLAVSDQPTSQNALLFSSAALSAARLKKFALSQKTMESAVRILFENEPKIPTDTIPRLETWKLITTLLLSDEPELKCPDYEVAHVFLSKALGEIEQAYNLAQNPVSRRAIQLRARQFYDDYARCTKFLLVDGRADAQSNGGYGELFETVEKSRARRVLQLLGGVGFPPMGADLKLRKKYDDVRKERAHIGGMLFPGRHASFNPLDGFGIPQRQYEEPLEMQDEPLDQQFWHLAQQDRKKLMSDYQNLVEQENDLLADLHQTDPDFDPDLGYPPVTWDGFSDLAATMSDTLFVQFTITHQGAWALLILGESRVCVDLPGLDSATLFKLSCDWHRKYLTLLPDQYLAEKPQTDEEIRQAYAQWADEIPILLQRLEQAAIHPIFALAQEADTTVRRWVIAAHNELHAFPLHACKLPNGKYLADLDIVYTPSLSTFYYLSKRPQFLPARLLLAQDPTGDLPGAALEAHLIGKLFEPQVTPLKGLAVTKEELISKASNCDAFHYCGHISFDAFQVNRSSLILADRHSAYASHWLSLEEVLEQFRLKSGALVVLSGCESGLALADKIDDFVNFPLAFLLAGASNVLSSFWALLDLPSALLIHRFYKVLLEHGPADRPTVASALQSAQRWLREDIHTGKELIESILPPILAQISDPNITEECLKKARPLAERYPDSPPFASPAYWAVFGCHGVG